MDIIETLCNVV